MTKISLVVLRLFRWLLLVWLAATIVALAWTAYAAPDGRDGDDFWRVGTGGFAGIMGEWETPL